MTGNQNSLFGSTTGNALTSGTDCCIFGYASDVDTGARASVIIIGASKTSAAVNGDLLIETSDVGLYRYAAGVIAASNGSRSLAAFRGSTLDLGIAGTSIGTLKMNGNTSGTISITSAAAAGTWTWTLPPDDGDAGEQLQTAGDGVTTWEAAVCLRESKNITGSLAPADALASILSASVSTFRYKRDGRATTGDFETEYAGIMADEAPWAMHHKGRIFNPVSAFGYTVAAIQELEMQIAALKLKLSELKS